MTKPAEPTQIVRAPCYECEKETKHDILCEATESGDENYSFFRSHSVIECRGCGAKSFRKYFQDTENAYPISDTEWECPEDIETYPRFPTGHLKIDIDDAPELVLEIYRESVLAIREDARTLAGLGLRGTIEAICNDQGITGRNLERRIASLATKGLISSNDADRLHAIRFLGNDAAHEILKPSRAQISVALKIVNHLVQSVYLLELEASGKLDTMITKLDQLKRLIDKKTKAAAKGSELPLAAILGRDIRRLGGATSQLEAQLVADVTAGSYPKLSMGKHDTYAGSSDQHQHFIIN